MSPKGRTDMILTETATATTIDDSAPAPFTCAQCPFARQIEDNRYCCSVSQTASDVKRGHWEATISCFEALAKAEAEQTPEPAAAEVEMAIAPATPSKPAPATPAPVATAPTATGENEELPNRGDNRRGRLQQPIKKVSAVQVSSKKWEEPAATKKLMLAIVPVGRISCDIPVCNFDRNELEIAGQLALTIGGFVIPPVVVRDSAGYKVVAGYFQYHAAVAARQLNPRAGETIPVILLESENQATALSQLKMLRFAA